MDDVQLFQAPPHRGGGARHPTFGSTDDVEVVRLEGESAVVIQKHVAGFPPEWVDNARGVIRSAAAGRFGPLKFLVLDLAVDSGAHAQGAQDAHLLIGDIANLILDASIITVAHVAKFVGGADLELALACSMLVCDEAAAFSFAADPIVSVTAYALLAQKIGFVRAERLMERDELLAAGEMRDLYLVKATTPAGSGLAGLEQFLERTSRRHNSAAAMYRAQRMASPLAPMISGEALRN